MINYKLINELYNSLNKQNKEWVDKSIEKIVQTKEKGGNIVVVTGSGPNIHEGVTTLIAELIHKGIVDAVTTSSAVVAHEMAGSLEKVHRVDGRKLGIPQEKLPLDNLVEASILPEEDAEMIREEFDYDEDYIARITG